MEMQSACNHLQHQLSIAINDRNLLLEQLRTLAGGVVCMCMSVCVWGGGQRFCGWGKCSCAHWQVPFGKGRGREVPATTCSTNSALHSTIETYCLNSCARWQVCLCVGEMLLGV